MGLFSSEYQTSVATAVQRVIPDDKLVGSLKAGTISAIFAGTDIADQVLENLVSGIGMKAERLYDWAKANYLYGLPSGQIAVSSQGQAAVQAVLAALEGQPVGIEYCHYGPPNLLHLAWMTLASAYGYQVGSNQLPGVATLNGQPAYLADIVLTVPQAMTAAFRSGMLSQWGPSPRGGYLPGNAMIYSPGLSKLVEYPPVYADPLLPAPTAQVTYQFVSTVVQGWTYTATDSFSFVLSDFVAGADYFQVRYVVNGATKFWRYRVGTGTYPTLDALFQLPPLASGEFFPFAYFRYNKTPQNQDQTSRAYTDSKKLLGYLGMDFNAITESIHANPNIADVEQALLTLAVPAIPDSDIERRYLFDFFNRLADAAPELGGSFVASDIDGRLSASSSGRSATVIQDAQFKMSLSHAGIVKGYQVATIGAIGSHAADVIIENDTDSGIDINGNAGIVTTQVVVHRYRRQVSGTLVEQLLVRDLMLLYHVFGEYSTAGYSDTDLRHLSPQERILLVPIDHAITHAYSPADRETLYSRSLHYVFNSRTVTEIKWYQQDWFTFVVLVVVAVVAIYTGQVDKLTAVLSALSAGTITVEAFLMMVAMKAIESIATGYVLKLFVKEVGGEFATVLAIALMAYAAYDGYAAGSLNAAPLAKDLVMLGNGLIKAVTAEVQSDFAELQADAVALNQTEQQQNAALQQAEDLLANHGQLVPFIYFGETPETYFNRTVHSGNIGMMGIDAVSNYVERSLSLPTLPTSFGGIYGL
jgi:hypothetical protein